MDDYHFTSGSFTTEIWIDNKRVFKRPDAIDVEFITPGAFYWVFADTNGKEVRTLKEENKNGGWTSCHLPSLGLYDDYSIGFRNNSPGAKSFKQGDIHF